MTASTEEKNRMVAIRTGLIEAIGEEYNYDVIFSALSHTAGAVIFSYLFDKDGGLSEDTVNEAITKFSENLRASAQEALKQTVVEAADENSQN